jgi:ATP-dependent Clp protease ATP-binding subunit ClpA
MRWLWNAFNRLPLIVQLLIGVLVWYYGMRVFGAVAWLFVPLAICFGLIVVFGLLHELGYTQKLFQDGGWLMTAIDRYSNRAVLESLLKNEKPSGKPITRMIDAAVIEAHLNEYVYGQREVCQDVARQIRTRFARETRDKPIGVFLLAGPPATGKTWFAKVLSEALYGPKTVVHYDMTAFSQPHTVSQLFGSPPGYAGSDHFGELTAALRAKSDRVILLDEFEKAHVEVQRKFLTAWNDGFVTEASTGEKVSTVNAVFVLTTNAAANQIRELTNQHEGDRVALSRACKAALRSSFPPEVMSRIDYVFPFVPLGDLDLADVIALHLASEVKGYGLEMDYIEPQVLVKSVRLARKNGDDAREVVLAIERQLSEQILQLKAGGATRVRIVDTGDDVAVEAVDPPPPRSGKRI